MIRIVAAAVVAGHGLIHLIGFVVPWGLAQVEGFPYQTTALGGAIALGDAGARAMGVAWLVCAVGFVVAGSGSGAGRPGHSRWPPSSRSPRSSSACWACRRPSRASS